MPDITRIDLNLLVALDALLELRSVSRAADRLSLTQPTVSGMLARLRDLFGDELFVRAQRGIRPTPRALALAQPLRRLLRDASSIVAPEIFDPAKARLTFTVSTTDYMQRSVIVPFIAALRRQAPGIKVAVKPLAIADLSSCLANGETDLAVTIPEFVAGDVKSRLLYRERYVCVVRARHPIRGTQCSLDEFCRYGHIVVSPLGGGFRGPVDEALASLGRVRNVALSVPNFLVLPDMLHAADLIAVVPARLLRTGRHGLRMFMPPLKLPGFDVIAAWHQRTHADAAHVWLRNLMRASLQGGTAD